MSQSRKHNVEDASHAMDHTRTASTEERAEGSDRVFYVRAPSINAVRRALDRAPGGVRVVGRHDRDSIVCTHTMDAHSLTRNWKIIVSRLSKAGLAIIPRPSTTA